jgi:SAM-dependent methyltransferase
VLTANLPAQGSVLDCGGGPGRYSIWLARKGYELTLFDLSAGCLQYAGAQATAAGVRLRCEQGTATDLGRFDAGEFHAVLLLGPLYHLLELDDRRRALTEAVRVLRPGGVLAAAFITRTAPLRYVAKEMAGSVGDLYGPMINVITRGRDDSFPPADDEHFHAYFVYPGEVGPLLRGAGLEVVGLFAAEGFVSMIDESVNALDGEEWEAWVDLNLRMAAEPSLLSGAEHVIALAKKPLA